MERYAPTSLKQAFRGVFSRDEIPPEDPGRLEECAIVNLSSLDQPGTHWVAYYKFGKTRKVYYYDSFGNLVPPRELLDVFSSYNIFYNRGRNQNFNSVICGQLCLRFLYLMNSVDENI